MSDSNPWVTTATKIVYTNPWITVQEDQVIRPDGSPGIYGVVHSLIACGVLAINERQEVYLVGQYRYPTKQYSWEIIEGGCPPGEEPLEAAKRELREEAGLTAGRWTPIEGELHLSNCISSERGYLFIAQDLQEVPAQPDATEVLQIKRVPFRELLEMVHGGQIQDTLTIIATLRAERILNYL